MPYSDLFKNKEAFMVEKALKSRTFWGAVLCVVTAFLKSHGIVATDPAIFLGSAGLGLGLYGARNAKK